MQKLIFVTLLAILGAVVFHKLPESSFLWEDQRSEALSQPLDQSNWRSELSQLWTAKKGESFRPLAPTLWMAIKAASPEGRMTPRAAHNLSLATHLAAASVVFVILALLLQSHGAAFMGALVFALHPLQVESVAHVAAYPHVLASALSLVALWQYFSYINGIDSWGRKKPMRHIHAATLAYALALTAAPLAVVTPLAAMVLRRFIPRRASLIAPKPANWPLVTWMILAVPVAWWAVASQQTLALADQLPFWAKPVVAADALSFYLSKLFAPVLIGPDYGRSPVFLLNHWWAYVTWILPATLALAIVYWRSKASRWYASAYSLLAIGVLPFLGFVLFESQAMSTVANRYAYLALLGPALAAAYTISMPRRAWLPALVVGYIGLFGWLTYEETGNWRDETALWSHAVRVNPASPLAHQALGDQFRLAGDWQAARGHYQKVLEVNAVSADIHFYLGEIERLHGDPVKAMELYRKTIELEPSFPEAWTRLGLSYMQSGDLAAAERHLDEAVRLAPDTSEPRHLLGSLKVKTGDNSAAIEHLLKALDAAAGESNDIRAEVSALLGLAYVRTDRADLAQTHIETALRLAPENLEAHRILGDIYYAQQRFADARPHYTQALKATPEDPVLLAHLGHILIAARDYGPAIEHFNRSLAAAPNEPEVLTALGIAQFRVRQLTEATVSLNRSLELKASQADPHYYLGDILRWQGNEEGARAEYYRALKFDPNHAEANYRLGTWFMKKNEVTRAAAHFQAALRGAPEDQRLIYALKQAEKIRSGGG